MDSDGPPDDENRSEEMWRAYMLHGTMPDWVHAAWYQRPQMRPWLKRLPTEPRCRICNYPFAGIGGLLVRNFFKIAPSRMNPQLCNSCEHAAHRYRGGTEIEMTLLFADVRGSTAIAEKLSPSAFSRLIDRYYQAATRVLYRANGMVEKLIGDEVTSFFTPGIAGPQHARVAVQAGQDILRATGHADRQGPWIPVGVGIHTGLAYVGTVGTAGGPVDIAVLGDTVNAAARIAAQAGAGEVLFSEAARAAAGLSGEGLEMRRLTLKGRSEPMDVWVNREIS